jgi:four helix bundle protein
MEENIVKDKSYKFALRVIKLRKYLNNKKEYILSKQILRSGTSIGANIEESVGGQSEKDFASKMAIAYKEARETRYWINLLKDSDYISSEGGDSLLKDCEELCRLLGKIIFTIKNKFSIIED